MNQTTFNNDDRPIWTTDHEVYFIKRWRFWGAGANRVRLNMGLPEIDAADALYLYAGIINRQERRWDSGVNVSEVKRVLGEEMRSAIEEAA